MAHTASRPAQRAAAARTAPIVGGRSAAADPRWPAVADALAALHAAGRRSVRIVDADCGAGGLLLHAVRHARALGFTAVEGRGIDGAPSLIARALTDATRLQDPGIGVTFEVADVATALAEEAEFPADILLWRGEAVAASAVAAAGRVIISDRPAQTPRALDMAA